MPSPSTIPSSSTNTSTSQEGYVALEDDPGSAGNNEPFEDSEEHTKKCLEDSHGLKQQGTDYFRSEQWAQALACYRSALGRLPKRVSKLKTFENTPKEDCDDDNEDTEADASETKDRGKSPEPAPLTGVEAECAKARAVLNANIGACQVKLGEHKEAVASCTEALADDPTYIKALQRRAACNEQLGTWSSLTGAQDDYNTLLSLLPPESPQVRSIRQSLNALKPRAEAAQKKETGEMLDKLKGLGNSILGNFGLSTDNFKFEPNGQGGYSMNFVR